MDIKTACFTIGESQGKVLLDIAKHYNFKETDEALKFVTFTAHEPAAWLSGLPSTWSAKKREGAKTAFVKLTKQLAVREALGAEVCESARSAIWNQFKVAKNSVLEELEHSSNTHSEPVLEIVEDVHSTHSIKKPRITGSRESVLEQALRKYIQAEATSNPGLAAVALTLLDAYLS